MTDDGFDHREGERITRDQMLAVIAGTVSLRSTCSRGRVGCVIAFNGRVMSLGYNGAPAGMPHCDHTCTDEHDCATVQTGWGTDGTLHGMNCPAGAPCRVAIHAEANAIADAAREGRQTADAELYTTHSPCLPCSQLIVSAGIVAVTYQQPYRDVSGIQYLAAAGVRVEQFEL